MLFLETARIRNVVDFLSLKKTEASPLIAIYQDWRRHCDLPTLKGYCLARHLLGLCCRFEAALTSVPHADAHTRKWMGSVLVTLTGGSKDFIITECQLDNVHEFLNERTKSWSDRLVAWRERNNLPPLRGSGKVAMVSGWKTSLKEALDVEKGTGRVLTEAEMLVAPPPDPNAPVELPKKKSTRKGAKTAKVAKFKDVREALDSEDLLASVLKEDTVAFLRSVGIRTPEQLMEADKQSSQALINKIVAFRKETTNAPAQVANCVR